MLTQRFCLQVQARDIERCRRRSHVDCTRVLTGHTGNLNTSYRMPDKPRLSIHHTPNRYASTPGQGDLYTAHTPPDTYPIMSA